jgi:uncharacterized protein YcbK (DUF882 family)
VSHRGLSLFALSAVLGTALGAFAVWPRSAPAAPKPRPTLLAVVHTPPPAPADTPRFRLLPALRIENQTTREVRELKLYDAEGRVDETAAGELDQLLCDARNPKRHEVGRIDRRTLQLLFKAAYHFQVSGIEVVSAYRKPGRRREGPHGTGSAIDFRLPGVSARELASYLRDIPRTGVGVYTHPKTQYVHLDNRLHSFHWLDASPPRRHWREKSIGSRDLEKRDALYSADQDWP